MTLKGTHVYTSMTMRKFTLGKFELSAQLIDNNPWFIGKDVARSLGYRKTRNAISRHVDNEDKKLISVSRPCNGAPLNVSVVMINEAGLYSLIFKSKLESAKEFKHWVTHCVLPSIRRTGKYELPKRHKDNSVITITDERTLHHNVVDYVRRFHPYALPLTIAGLGELQRTKQLRIESWKKGYQRGQPDLIINMPQNRARFNNKGLVIELKTPLGCGKLSPDQERILSRYSSVGYETMVSSDFLDVIRVIDKYMAGVLPYDCSFCNRSFSSEKTLNSHKIGFHRISKLSE